MLTYGIRPLMAPYHITINPTLAMTRTTVCIQNITKRVDSHGSGLVKLDANIGMLTWSQ